LIMANIHPTALVDPSAVLGEDVEIGPFCTVGPRVSLDRGVRLVSHVNIDGLTSLGEGCLVYPFASLGTLTQDLKYKGGQPGVRIGRHTTIREYVTVNTATFDGDYTVVGSHCLLMAYVHVAHDCVIGDEVIIANGAQLAGHICIEDQVVVGGLVGLHQFVRLGRMAIIGGCSKVIHDVPPFMLADGAPLKVHGLNLVGLKRRGVSAEDRNALKAAYKILYRRGLTTSDALAELRAMEGQRQVVCDLIRFIETSERGIMKS